MLIIKSGFIAAATLCICMTGHAFAQIRMTGPQIKNTLAGKTIYLATPLGTELPIYFSRRGRVTGAAGSLAPYIPSKKTVTRDRGSWWVRANRMCKRWKNWFGGKTHCFRLSKSGNSLHWVREDGKSGDARIARR